MGSIEIGMKLTAVGKTKIPSINWYNIFCSSELVLIIEALISIQYGIIINVLKKRGRYFEVYK